MTVRIANQDIGNGHPCFIVFEAGPTHNGLESAKALASLAKEAGANAVKFQLTNPERVIANRAQPFSYEVLVNKETGETRTVTEPLYDILKRRALSRDQWREVKAHCDGLGLAFFTTAAFLDDIDFLAGIGCQTVKIASADVNHLPLIRHAARSGMVAQLDTGNATIGEVEASIDVFLAAGGKDVIIHHCPSGYPARLESINLRIVSTLRSMFEFPVAFSDHTPGWDMDIAAIALGANLVEKTITFDRTTPSIEHMFSLEPPDMAKFVRAVRDLEVALGRPRKVLAAVERENRIRGRRSAHLLRDVAAGEALTEENFEFKRPGFGVAPDRIEDYLGMTFVRAMTSGACVTRNDLRPGK